MIIDFHTHPEFKNLKEKYSPDEFVKGMDIGGIDISCVFGCDQSDAGSCPPWQDKKQIAVPINISDEELATFCNKFPKRLIGITSIDPRRYKPEHKVERAD